MLSNFKIHYVIIVLILGAIIIYGLLERQNDPAPKWMVMQCATTTCTLEEKTKLSDAGIHVPLLKDNRAYKDAILKELEAHHRPDEQASILAALTLHFDQNQKQPMLSAEEVSKFQNLVDSSEG